MSSTRPTARRSASASVTSVSLRLVAAGSLSCTDKNPPDIGANASAEEASEDAEDSSQTVIDVVHSFRLNETVFDKKSYLSHLKSTL